MMPLDLASDFTLLRPAWLLVLPLVVWLLGRRRADAAATDDAAGNWAPLIDAHLRPQLLAATPGGPAAGARRPLPRWLPQLAATLAVVALAGPAHRADEGSAPLRPAVTRLFLVDLSPGFAALPAALQERTRHKLQALLGALPPADSGLVVHDAADAYLVVPPTTDAGSLARWLPELSAAAMPTQPPPRAGGESAALRLAGDVLRRHGGKPEVFWVSARPANELVASIAATRETLPGSAVRILQIAAGDLPPSSPTGPSVVPMRADDADLQALVAGAAAKWHSAPGERGSAGWRDLGPWLLLALLPLAAALVVGPAAAGGAAPALALALIVGGGPLASRDVAAANDDVRWQAIAAYRAGDYASAAARFAAHDDADSLYNRGNALARLGRLPEALAAYDAALARRAGDADFRHNRDLVAKLLQSPPPPKAPPPPGATAQQEAQRAAEQWLRRVRDTPPAGSDSLLRRKVAIEAERRAPSDAARPLR